MLSIFAMALFLVKSNEDSQIIFSSSHVGRCILNLRLRLERRAFLLGDDDAKTNLYIKYAMFKTKNTE